MWCHFRRVRLFVTLRTVDPQAPLSLGILQAGILEWVAMPTAGFITASATWEAQDQWDSLKKPLKKLRRHYE